jgi:hypothetical protein
MSTLVLVDVLANDGWPALAALEDSCGLVTMYHFVLLVQSFFLLYGISYHYYIRIGWGLHLLHHKHTSLPSPGKHFRIPLGLWLSGFGHFNG